MILKKKLKRGGRSFQNAKGVWVVPKMKKAKVNIQTLFFTTRITNTNIGKWIFSATIHWTRKRFIFPGISI